MCLSALKGTPMSNMSTQILVWLPPSAAVHLSQALYARSTLETQEFAWVWKQIAAETVRQGYPPRPTSMSARVWCGLLAFERFCTVRMPIAFVTHS